MTLDDETADRIILKAGGDSVIASIADYERALVRAGYAHRDAEVEELRAQRDGWASRMMEFAAAQQTLAKVREYCEKALAVTVAGSSTEQAQDAGLAAVILREALDESPTEREALCDTEHPITGRLCSLPEGHEPGHICDRETPADEWEYRARWDGDDSLWFGVAAERVSDWIAEGYEVQRRRKQVWEVVPDDRA